ncbi:MAG: YdcF family protein [Bacteroidota bacterium]|nr:YdcF family protein [Bacteroidota bacterium]
MFFYLSKLLSFILSPVIWIVALLAVAVFTKKDKRKKRYLFWAFLVVVIFSNSFLLDEVMRHWERPAIKSTSIEKKYDFGIVLTGGVLYDAQVDRIDFKAGSDRLFQAIDLYKNNHIKKILISGGSPTIFKRGYTEAGVWKDYLLKIGIPARDIIVESESRNTHENAVNSTKIILDEKKNPKCLLITSAYHIKRAKDCFTQSKLEVDVYPVDRFAGPRKFNFNHLLVPSAQSLHEWYIFIHEFTGYYIYALMGYV